MNIKNKYETIILKKWNYISACLRGNDKYSPMTAKELGEHIGISPATISKYRKQYPEFDELFDKTQDELKYSIQQKFYDRLLNGSKEVEIIEEFSRGQFTPTHKKTKIKQSSDSLLQFAMRNLFNDEFNKDRKLDLNVEDDNDSVEKTMYAFIDGLIDEDTTDK